MPLTSLAPTPVLPALRIGRHTVDSPVVLAPMAGITNRAFRRLCRQYGVEGAATVAGEQAGSGSSCLYVSEMITSRALVERTPASMRLIEHDPDEAPRSIQLYGVERATVGEMLAAMDRVRPGASDLVRRMPDPVIAGIVGGWPAAFAPQRAQALGFSPPGTLDAMVRSFIEDDLAATAAERA